MNKRKNEKELAAAFGEMIKERYEAVQKRKRDANREKRKLAGKTKDKELAVAFGEMIKERYEAVQKRKKDAEKAKRRKLGRENGKLYIHTRAGTLQSSNRPSRISKTKTTGIPKTNDGASTSGSCFESEARKIPQACNRVEQMSPRKLLDKSTFTEGQPKLPPSRTRIERKEKRSAGWEERRPEIFAAFLKKESPPLTKENCVNCNSNPSIIRCENGCEALCVTCDALKHKFLATHVRNTWAVGFKTTLKSCQTLVLQQDGSYSLGNEDRAIPARLESNCKNCGSGEVEYIIDIPCIFVSVRGQQDVFLPALKCHSCTFIHKVDWENLVASNYFAGSSSIYGGCYIFSTEILRAFFFLRMESPELAVRAFLASLQRLSEDLDARVTNISPIAFKDAFEEWVRCTSRLNGFVGEVESGRDCSPGRKGLGESLGTSSLGELLYLQLVSVYKHWELKSDTIVELEMNKRNISNKKPCPHCSEPLHYLRKTCSECKNPTHFKEETMEKRNGKLRESFEKGLKASLQTNSLMRIKQSISKQMAKLEGVGYASVLLIIGRKPSYRSSFLTYNETIEKMFVEEKSCGRKDLTLRGHHILTFLKDEYISAVDKEDSQPLPDSAEDMEEVEASADEDHMADKEDVDELPINTTHGKESTHTSGVTKTEKKTRTKARKAKNLKACSKKEAKRTKTAEEQSNQKTQQLPISPAIHPVKGNQELEPELDVMVKIPDIQRTNDQQEQIHTVALLSESNLKVISPSAGEIVGNGQDTTQEEIVVIEFGTGRLLSGSNEVNQCVKRVNQL